MCSPKICLEIQNSGVSWERSFLSTKCLYMEVKPWWGCLRSLDTVTVELFCAPCGYFCLKVNWRKNRMGSWIEYRWNTWSIPEMPGNDLAPIDSTGFRYRPGMWMRACPTNALCFIAQPLTKQTVHHSDVRLWSLGFVKHWKSWVWASYRAASINIAWSQAILYKCHLFWSALSVRKGCELSEKQRHVLWLLK